MKSRSVFDDAGYQLRLGERAGHIDRDDKTITLSDQSTLKYGQLVLATGSRVRRLNAPGADLKGLHYLHDMADSDALRDVKSGLKVTVLEAAERLMQRVTGPEISAFFCAKHRAAGVEVRLGTAVTGFEAGDHG